MNISGLLTRDTFILNRKGGVDSEGNEISTYSVIGSYKGTWGSPSSRDIEIAARSDSVVDGVIAGSFPARIDDKVTELRGSSWVVTHIRPLVTHKRYFLRRL